MTLVDHIWWQISKPVNHQFHTTGDLQFG